MTFQDLGLNPEILAALESLNFTTPTPIQEKTIPRILSSAKDLIALAQTGTGKTAAFSLPIIQQINENSRDVQAIVLCPTRELCIQICSDIEKFTKNLKRVRTVAIYGGAWISKQIKTLHEGVQIIVATPGRLCDIIERGKVDLETIKWLVLDEADEMLKMGFKDELEMILNETPEDKQTMLFSATMPKQIAQIASKYMRTPEQISVSTDQSTKQVEHHYYLINNRDRYQALKRIADFHPEIYGIVFCQTRRETQEVNSMLIQDHYAAEAIHGDLSQEQRSHVMERFKKKHIRLLVATDVAARGIDVENLSHIINYNLPQTVESYVHRSGRTGRAQKKGVAISLVTPSEQFKVRLIENKIKHSFIKELIPTGDDICKKQLSELVKKIKSAKVNEDLINEGLEKIYGELHDLDKDELIKKFLSIEFNKFLSFYEKSEDLNRNVQMGRSGRTGGRDFGRGGHGGNRGGGRFGGDVSFVGGRRFGGGREGSRSFQDRDSRKNFFKNQSSMDFIPVQISLGKKDQFDAKGLFQLINRNPILKGAQIGKIDITNEKSIFEIDKKYERKILGSFQNEKFNGRPIKLTIK